MADVFDHVTIRVSDVDASLRFYRLAFAQLGYAESYRGDGFHEWNDFSIWAAQTGKPVTRGLHLALVAESRQAVDDWWRAILAASARIRDRHPVEYGRVTVICMSSQWGGLVAVDADGRHVHPAVTWMDSRGSRYSQELTGGRLAVPGGAR